MLPASLAAAAALAGCGGGSSAQNQQAAGKLGPGATLEDKQAYDLFQGYCAQTFARGFKLYKLYGRAAGFAGVQR